MQTRNEEGVVHTLEPLAYYTKHHVILMKIKTKMMCNMYRERPV
jgi:hypothetical protein